MWGPPSLLFSGYRRYFLEQKWPGLEVNHSRPSSAEVKKEWDCISGPPTCLHGIDRTDATFVPKLYVAQTQNVVLTTAHEVHTQNPYISEGSSFRVTFLVSVL